MVLVGLDSNSANSIISAQANDIHVSNEECRYETMRGQIDDFIYKVDFSTAIGADIPGSQDPERCKLEECILSFLFVELLLLL